MDEFPRQDLISRGGNLGLNANVDNWEDVFINNDSAEKSLHSTILPATLETVSVAGPTTTISTIVIVSLSIVVAIAILFVLSLFIDYRQQKISERNQQCIIKRRKPFNLKLPYCRRMRNPNGIVEDAEETIQTSPPLETITEVV